jgi:hypothetical protein
MEIATTSRLARLFALKKSLGNDRMNNEWACTKRLFNVDFGGAPITRIA